MNQRRCGLCGKTEKLIKTPCCDHWICDDTHKYVLFSYATTSCYRNHDRYTLCAAHYSAKTVRMNIHWKITLIMQRMILILRN